MYIFPRLMLLFLICKVGLLSFVHNLSFTTCLYPFYFTSIFFPSVSLFCRRIRGGVGALPLVTQISLVSCSFGKMLENKLSCNRWAPLLREREILDPPLPFFPSLYLCLSVGTRKGGNIKAPKQHSIVKKQLQHL